MAIDINGADTWFGSTVHIKASIWAGFSATLRTAAVAQAKRFLERALADGIGYGVSYELDTDATTDSDFPRHDAACYEQALWMLEHSDAVPNGQQSSPKFIAGKSSGKIKPPMPPAIAPEALRWLVNRPGVLFMGRG